MRGGRRDGTWGSPMGAKFRDDWSQGNPIASQIDEYPPTIIFQKPPVKVKMTRKINFMAYVLICTQINSVQNDGGI